MECLKIIKRERTLSDEEKELNEVSINQSEVNKATNLAKRRKRTKKQPEDVLAEKRIKARIRMQKLRSRETAEARESRLEKDRLRHIQARAMATAEFGECQKIIKQERTLSDEEKELDDVAINQSEVIKATNLAKRRKRANKQTVDVLVEKRIKARIRMQKLRSKETAEERESRLEKDRLRHIQARSIEPIEVGESRREKDRIRHFQARLSESFLAGIFRREKDRLRHIRARSIAIAEFGESSRENDRLCYLQTPAIETAEVGESPCERKKLGHSQARSIETPEVLNLSKKRIDFN